MYKVKFWSFAKKSNSTKIPAIAATAEYDCEIMDGSGLINPTIRLNTNFASPIAFTYCEIPALNRKYFVGDWSYDKGVYWASLVLDVLGTYKTEIGNLSLYVARSSAEMDGRIIDTKYPIKVGTSKAQEQNNLNPFATPFGSGYFVVGIINNDSNAMGVTSYYVFTMAEFRAFAAFLLGDSSYLGSPPEISQSLLKCLVNPTQYIASCIWIPTTPSMGAAVTTIPIGWWSISGMSCHKLSSYTRAAGSVGVSVPKHPDALTRGYYLLQEPYTTYYLDFPPFGAISIPANDLVDETYLDLHWNVDCITGQGRLEVLGGPTGARGTITIVEAQIGVPVALAQNAPDITGAAQEFISGHDSAQPDVAGSSNYLSESVSMYSHIKAAINRHSGDSGGAVTSTIMNTLTNIASALVASKLPVQVIGGNGGFMAGYYPIRLIATFATLAPDNNAEWGRPLCRVKTLSTIAGFIQCADADFEISCTAPERAAIADYLTKGFYYE